MITANKLREIEKKVGHDLRCGVVQIDGHVDLIEGYFQDDRLRHFFIEAEHLSTEGIIEAIKIMREHRLLQMERILSKYNK